MTSTAGLPPRPTLLYMFADQLIEPDDWKSAGTAVPGQDKKVKTKSLAAHLYAVAFWGLAQDGLISLAVEEKKRLGIRTKKVVARPAQAALPPRGYVLEDGILEVVAAGREDVVHKIVHEALREDHADPAGYVVAMAKYDGSTAGFFTKVDAGRNKLGRLVLGGEKTVPVLERFPEAQPAFAELLNAWQSFRASDPQLAQELLDACDKGIKSRVEADDDD
jgi:hypothetical protein